MDFNHIDWKAVSGILTVTVPLVTAVAHALGKKIPPVWATVLHELDPEDSDSLVSQVLDAGKRKNLARSKVQKILRRYGIQHDDGTEFTTRELDTIVEQAVRAGKAGIRYASTRLKK